MQLIFFVVEVNGRVESYGVCSSKEEFKRKKEMLEDFGCGVIRVSFRTWKRCKEAIDKTEIKRRDLKCVNMS